jgi:FAD/FMN-containing dehydrogenase
VGLPEAPPSERRDVERRRRSLEHLARYDRPTTEKYSLAAPKRVSISGADCRKVLHTVTREKAQKLYPMHERFNEIREKLDPKGIFVNGFMRDLFG